MLDLRASWSVTGSGCVGGSGGGIAGWFPVWGGGALGAPREPGVAGGGGSPITNLAPVIVAAANITTIFPKMEMSSVGDIACSKGMASVAGATAGGFVTGGLTGAATGKGNPYSIGVSAILGAAMGGGGQAIANVTGPYIGGSASGAVSNIFSSYVSDPSPSAVAFGGLSSYFISKVVGDNPGRGAVLSGRVATYTGIATVANRGLGSGALVAGPVFGIAGAVTDYSVESGWNNYCGN